MSKLINVMPCHVYQVLKAPNGNDMPFNAFISSKDTSLPHILYNKRSWFGYNKVYF